MARYDRFWITPIAGWRNDVRPWKIMDNAFAKLKNAYVFRGRVRKRFGGTFLFDSNSPPILGFEQFNSRLRIEIDTIVSGDAAGTVPGAIINKIGHAFSVDDIMFTVFNDAAGPQDMHRTDGSVSTATYDVSTGNYDIQGTGKPDTTPVFWYPAEPVMGFVVYEQGSINNSPTYAFDTQFAYRYVGGGWDRISTVAPHDIWTGGNANFFQATTWRGIESSDNVLYVTNYFFGTNLNNSDRIRFWNGTTWDSLIARWGANATDTTMTARIIVQWKDRLWLFNVVENTGVGPGSNTLYQNRVMFSQAGSPLDVDAFRRDIPGRGGFNDCSTKEAIISVTLYKDRCIVYFETSTWELVYTGNQTVPAVWQKLNNELGAESTFSIINFDKVVLGVGKVGIHATSGTSVERIDNAIPSEVFTINNDNDGPQRVHGIRDYNAEQVYWSFPSQDNSPTFPTQVLVYNYATGTWALNDDSITAFGQFLKPSALTWATWTTPWAQSSDPWNTGSDQALHREIVAGNQEGYTFIVDTGRTRNAAALQITDIDENTNRITIINHNLSSTDYILIENITGSGGITDINGRIFNVILFDVNTIEISFDIVGTYTGGGTITRVSVIDILTKQYNPYNEAGRNIYVPRIEFYVDVTDTGEFKVESFASSNPLPLGQEGMATGSLLGNQTLITASDPNIFKAQQQQIWSSVYFQVDGELAQFRIFMNDEQMTRIPDAGDIAVPLNDFTLHAMIIFALKSTDR